MNHLSKPMPNKVESHDMCDRHGNRGKQEGSGTAGEKEEAVKEQAPQVVVSSSETDNASINQDRTRKRCRLIALGTTFLLVVAAVAVTVPVLLSSNNNDDTKPRSNNDTDKPGLSSTSHTPSSTLPLSGHGPWQPVGEVLHGLTPFDFYGSSVSLSRDANVVAVGVTGWPHAKSEGYVHILQFNQATEAWTRMGNYIESDAYSESHGDRFGESVSLNGDGTILAVGAPGRDRSHQTDYGRVRVYEFNYFHSNWVQLGGDLEGINDHDLFGHSVSLSKAGDILAVGSPFGKMDDGQIAGSVRLFQYNRMVESWEELGQKLLGQTDSVFGWSVSLSSSGTIVGVGSDVVGDDGATWGEDNGTGQVSVFEFNSSTGLWEPLGNPIIGQDWRSNFGYSISLDDSGLVMAVGAPERGGCFVFEYDRTTSTWKQRGQALMGNQRDDRFGRSVSLNGAGNVVAVGSDHHNHQGLTDAGQVRIFQFDTNTSTWKQVGDDMNGGADYDEFGGSVSLSADGTVVGVGGIGHDANGEDTGSVYVLTAPRSRESEYNIDVEITGNVSPGFRVATADAVARWEEVITGDLPSYNLGGRIPSGCTKAPGIVDDLLVCISVEPMDKPLGIGGDIRVTTYRNSSWLPATARMRIDSYDVDRFERNGTLTDIILHELGHAVGIGTIWQALDLVGFGPDNVMRYNQGTAACREYERVTDCTGCPPIENKGDSGNIYVHWNEFYLDSEIMTGVGVEELSGLNSTLSAITIGSLEDMGYQVSYRTAEPLNSYMCEFKRRRIMQEEEQGIIHNSVPLVEFHGQGEKSRSRRKLSDKGRAAAVAYGQEILRQDSVKAHTHEDSTNKDVLANGVVFVLYIEGDHVFSVGVTADGV